jgi:HAD superfamily hydrolase (TIGR01509 family)
MAGYVVDHDAVLFDMDGVVVDSEAAVHGFWRAAAAAHGIEISPHDFHRHVYGVPAGHTLDALFSALDQQQRADVLARMYAVEANGPYHEIPGARDLLLRLRGCGIPTALVTSAEPPKVDTVIQALDLHDLFAAIVTAADIQRGKPDPEGYLLAAARLGIEPTRCLVLEDAVSGVEAAVRAGCTCVGVASPDRVAALRAAGAIEVVPDLRAIFVDRSGALSA